MTPRHIALLALLMTCAFLVVGQLYVAIPLVGDIAQRFGADPASAVLASSVFGFAYAAGFLVFGPLSDRFGRRRVILAGLVATGFATALVGLAQGFGLLLAARILQGFAASAFPPVALSLVAEELPPRHRPLGVSLMSFAFLGAAPLAQVYAAGSGEMPVIMLQLAPLYLLGAAGLFHVIRAGDAPVATQGHGKTSRLSSLLRDPMTLTAWAAAITVLFGFVSFHAGAQALGGRLDINLQTLRLIGLPPLLLTFAATPLTRRFGPSVTARAGLLLAALGLTTAVIGAPAVMAASAILSGGVALAVPGLIATVAGRASNANRGLALATYSFCLFLGASFAPPAAQALAGIGGAPLWLAPAALLIIAALGVTAAARPRNSLTAT